MAKAIARTEGAVLVAVAARDSIARAASFAGECGAEKAYGCYEDLLKDHDVDAVYVATIHPLHADAVRASLRAGKAVLCEKPLTTTALEAAALFREAEEQGVLLMEAMWTRFLPAWREAKMLVDAGTIGSLRNFQADFSGYTAFDPESRLYNVAKGGGALLDVGVYSIHMALFILGTWYDELRACGRLSPTGTDSFAGIMIRYSDGAMATLTCGCDTVGTESACLCGTAGWIEIPHMYRADRLIIHKGGRETVMDYPIGDGFEYQLEEFCRLLQEGKLTSVTVPPAHTVRALEIVERAIGQIRGEE